MKDEKTQVFEWITNRSTEAFVTIDNLKRLYISRPAKDLMNIPDTKFRLIAGYDFVNDRIVLAKPEVVRIPDVKPFSFDKRGYSNAKYFVERANLEAKLPVRFVFRGRDYANYPEGSFCFELEGSTPADS